MEGKSQYLENTDARKVACGYRIQTTCASCKHCKRRGSESAPYHFFPRCDFKDFPVNLDRGICDFFEMVRL